ncbi:MAG: DASH family cryptochrome [Bacteroidetes bacterium]|nr:DASH family cryptochrome [Bacteroidota bacterium]
MEVVLLWFRADLRVQDHPALYRACQLGLPVLPVFILEDRWRSRSEAGVSRLGPFRAHFLARSLEALQGQLAQLGLPLLIRQGEAVAQLSRLLDELPVAAIYAHTEPAWEEQQQEKALKQLLDARGIALDLSDGNSLYNVEDMPYTAGQVPELFTHFRKKIEPSTLVRSPLPVPSFVLAPEQIPAGCPLPDAQVLCAEYVPERHIPEQTGGEPAALAWLQEYIWERQAVATYKDTRNGLMGTHFSSRLSEWLALGCLSPRYVYDQVRRYEHERQKNESTYWLQIELLWRDYFRLMARKHGRHLFGADGLSRVPIAWKADPLAFRQWCQGLTGYPLVDAAMRQLMQTGWMSNRARQVTGSFLTKNLQVDWRWGAQWFEYWLTDYAPSSNYGNWNYVAGVGNDGSGFRFFHPVKQGETYDPQGLFVKHFLPELEALPPAWVHRPWELPGNLQRTLGFAPGTRYPAPVVDILESAREAEVAYKKGLVDGNHKKSYSRIRKFVK